MKILNSEELRESLQNVTFICIGPITNKTLLEYGFKGFMPASYTIEDMVKLMTELIK
jgi:uroporphyrinogen-III synthase